MIDSPQPRRPLEPGVHRELQGRLDYAVICALIYC